MDKHRTCSLVWILYIDRKAIFTIGGHYQKTSSCLSGEILSKLNLVTVDRGINAFPLLLSCTLLSASPRFLLLTCLVSHLSYLVPAACLHCLQVPQTLPPLRRPPLRRSSTVRLVRICQRCRQWHPCQKTRWKI